MIRSIQPLAILCSLILFAGMGRAQVSNSTTPITGTYEIKNSDGTPLIDGHTFSMAVFPVPGTGHHIGMAYHDKNDGNGPVLMPQQCVAITPALPQSDYDYNVYVNTGNSSEGSRKSNGDFETEVTTGPHAGTKRLWERT